MKNTSNKEHNPQKMYNRLREQAWARQQRREGWWGPSVCRPRSWKQDYARYLEGHAPVPGEVSEKRSDIVQRSPEVPVDLLEKEYDGQEDGGKDDQEQDPTIRLEKASERLAEDRPHVRVHRIQVLENESEQPRDEDKHAA